MTPNVPSTASELPTRDPCPLVFRCPASDATRYTVGALASVAAFVLSMLYFKALPRFFGPLSDEHPVALPGHILFLVAGVCSVWLGYRAVSGWLLNLLVRYEIDDRCLRKTTPLATRETAWEQMSSFSETEPTHREGDPFCRIKAPDGETCVDVGPHMLGREGPRLLGEIRRRLGPPALKDPTAIEFFRYAESGNLPACHLELSAGHIAAVTPGGEVRLALDEVESISVRASPESGTGLEKASIAGGGKTIELDSRLGGFWPLLEYIAERAPGAAVEDRSRRFRTRRRRLGAAPTAEAAPSDPAGRRRFDGRA